MVKISLVHIWSATFQRRTEMEQGRFNISYKDDVPSPTDDRWISLDGLKEGGVIMSLLTLKPKNTKVSI